VQDRTKVLYIEDDKNDIRVVKKLLLNESDGFSLATACTLATGLKRLTSQKYEIILLDPDLPDSQGRSTVTTIVQAAPGIPVLVLTANEEDDETSPLERQDSLCKCKLNAYHLKRSIRHILERQALVKHLAAKSEALKDSESRFRKLILENPDAILIVDKDGYVRFANPAVESLLGRPPESLLCKQFGFPITGQHQVELDIIRSDAQRKVVEARVQEIEWEGRDGYLATLREITSHKEMEHNLQLALQKEQYLSQHDSLTDLPNRLLCNDRLEHAIEQARRSGDEVAILFLDLNNFKHINDSLGHDTGDMVLKAVADRLKKCIRDCDTIARMGGDEFIIILERIVNREDVAKVARKIIREISPAITCGQKQVQITTSIGIAFFPHDGLTSQNVLSHADTAMYRAKKKRQDYAFYDYGHNVEFNEYVRLKKRLFDVMSNGELRLHYQPQIDLATDSVIGVEALVRWEHPELGLLFPARFMDLAEESGLIVPIGEWVLETACRQIRSWVVEGKPCFRISINLSPRQFYTLHLDSIRTTLERTGMECGQLVLEITEACAMQDVNYTVKVLSQLRKMGVRIALDDFGTGYASLNYLKQFPIDIIKLDRSFIKELDEKREEWTVTGIIVEMAHKFKLRVVAEGVERHEQLCYLRSLKCNEYQGFYFSKALPENEITELLGKHKRNGTSRRCSVSSAKNAER